MASCGDNFTEKDNTTKAASNVDKAEGFKNEANQLFKGLYCSQYIFLSTICFIISVQCFVKALDNYKET